MGKRDDELDSMLESLRGTEPTALEKKRWIKALGRAPGGGRKADFFGALLAAILLGAVLGGLLMNSLAKEPVSSCSQALASNIGDSNATFEQIYIKLD